MRTSSTILPYPRQNPSRFEGTDRIPSSVREQMIRRQSGRPWNAGGLTDEQIGTALGINRRNAAKRRSGEAGPWAGACVELSRLAMRGYGIFEYIAHLRSIEMQASMQTCSVEELRERLERLDLMAAEASLELHRATLIVRADPTSDARRKAALALAGIAEEITACEDELATRRKRGECR